MADKWISYEVENEDQILAQMTAYEMRARAHLRDLLNELAEAGVKIIRHNAPTYSRYLVRHVDRSEVSWAPGGAGGGGSYQTIVGVKRGTSKHPLYVEFGTGLYGAVGWYIVPLKSAFMVFYGSRARRVLWKRAVRGQKPQRYFYSSWHELLVYSRARVLGNIH